MAGVGPFKKEAGIGPLKNITVSRVDVPLTASMTSFPLRISGETSQIDVIVPWKMTSRRCLHFVSPLLSVLLHSPLSSFYFLFSVFCFLFSIFYFLFSIFCFLCAHKNEREAHKYIFPPFFLSQTFRTGISANHICNIGTGAIYLFCPNKLLFKANSSNLL